MTEKKKKQIERSVERMKKIYEYNFFDDSPRIDEEDENLDSENDEEEENGDENDINPSNDEMPLPMGDMDNQDGSSMPDDKVVDITDLVDAQDGIKDSQEDIEQKQNDISNNVVDVDKKLATLLKVVDKFTKALEDNDRKIMNLKQELTKRVPTDEETMMVRINAGGNPYREKIDDYWKRFSKKNNHYKIVNDDEVVEKEPKYKITKGDIDNFNEHIFDDDYNNIPQGLTNYF